MRFKAFVTTGIIENSRLLHGLAPFRPFLKNGVILAFFHGSGKGLVDTDWLLQARRSDNVNSYRLKFRLGSSRRSGQAILRAAWPREHQVLMP